MITENKQPDDLHIILVRAGATELDAQGRITGSLDLPISPESESFIQRTVDELSDLKIDAVYSARCLAARQTAQKLTAGRKLKVRIADEMVNLDHGLWHGKSIMELKETQPRLFRQWQENPETVCPPGGESYADARKRIGEFLKKIRKKHRSGTVVVVVPDPLLSVMASRAKQAPAKDLFDCVSKSGQWQTLNPATTQLAARFSG